MSERKKPDIVFCAQAISRIEKGTFFDDYDQASADLGHLRDLLAGYADAAENAALKARKVTVQEAARVLLENRWTGYGSRKAMVAMWEYLSEQHNWRLLPQSAMDGVLQSALRALAGDDQ